MKYTELLATALSWSELIPVVTAEKIAPTAPRVTKLLSTASAVEPLGMLEEVMTKLPEKVTVLVIAVARTTAVPFSTKITSFVDAAAMEFSRVPERFDR